MENPEQATRIQQSTTGEQAKTYTLIPEQNLSLPPSLEVIPHIQAVAKLAREKGLTSKVALHGTIDYHTLNFEDPEQPFSFTLTDELERKILRSSHRAGTFAVAVAEQTDTYIREIVMEQQKADLKKEQASHGRVIGYSAAVAVSAAYAMHEYQNPVIYAAALTLGAVSIIPFLYTSLHYIYEVEGRRTRYREADPNSKQHVRRNGILRELANKIEARS